MLLLKLVLTGYSEPKNEVRLITELRITR